MNSDNDALRRKNEELHHDLRERNKKLLQTQELYDKMKRRGMLDQVQTAASNAVDDTIQATTNGNRFTENPGTNDHRPPLYANQQTGGLNHASGFLNSTMPPPPQRRRHSSEWDNIGSQGQSHVSQHCKKHLVATKIQLWITYEECYRQSCSGNSFLSSTAFGIQPFSSYKHR
jgi:E3 ubiquitin-protein ligase CCNP1IP1